MAPDDLWCLRFDLEISDLLSVLDYEVFDGKNSIVVVLVLDSITVHG